MEGKGKQLPSVIILAGGKGSRSSNPTLPKLLQNLDDTHTLLDHWVYLLSNQGFKNIIFVVAHGAEQIISEVSRKYSDESKLKIKIVVEGKPEGTQKATLAGFRDLDEALVVMGDSLSYINYKFHYLKWKESKTDLGIFAHNNAHLHDSDTVFFDKTSRLTRFSLKGQNHDDENLREHRLALTGAFFVTSTALSFPWEESNGELVSYLSAHFNQMKVHILPFVEASLDTGTPLRLDQAIKLHRRRGCGLLGEIFVILDRDGTLIPDVPEGRKSITHKDVHPDSAKAIHTLNAMHIPVFLVTNQPAIAKGWITNDDVERSHYQLRKILYSHQAWIDDFFYCQHHPERGFEGEVSILKIDCNCRKPKTGLALDLISKYGLREGDAVVIGDSEADAGLASNLGVPYYFSKFESDGKGNLGDVVNKLVREKCF